MDNELKHTKKRLTIIFSIIVFVLVLLLWSIYFSSKYIKEINFEKSDFKGFISFLKESNLTSDTIINRNLRFWWSKFERWNTVWLIPPSEIKTLNKNIPKPRNFISYILIDWNKKIISSDTKDEIENKLISLIIENTNFSDISITSWLLSTKLDVENWKYTLILFNKLRYSLEDYLSDILGFIFVSVLFSILVYIVWYRFVDRTLIPVEQSLKDMKDFVQNAWHELKTPLSVIDSNLQLIKDLKNFDWEMVLEMKDEVSKLNSLIDSLINLSTLKWKELLDNINLKEIIDEILKNYKIKIDEKKLDLKVNITKNIYISSNKEHLYILLSNIIWNAIKYNKKWWKLEISYKKDELIINDNWVWIDKNHITKIFDRFYKADKSRNSEWFGIGLSLVKKIADIYNWKIIVESEVWIWTKFKIKF